MWGGGGFIRASNGILQVLGATDHDWRALECIRSNGLPKQMELKRTTPGSQRCQGWIKTLQPEVLLSDSYRRFHEQGMEEARESVRAAVSIVQTFIESDAHLLVLQSTSYLVTSAEWTMDLSSLLTREGCAWTSTELSAI